MPAPESRLRRIAIAQGLAIAACCGALFAVVSLLHLAEAFDLKFLDWRFRLRGERPASDSIALVGVDDATIAAYHAWPLPRDAYALLLTALEEGGARAIGLDLQFPADKNQDPRFDALLAYVTASHRDIVHAIGFHSKAQSRVEPIDPDLDEAVRRQGVLEPDLPVPEAGEMGLPYPDLALSAGALAHVNVSIDKDGAIRRLPFFIRHEGRAYPALSLRLIGIAHGDTALPDVRPVHGGAEVHWGGGRVLRIPVDRHGSTLLDFSGDRASFPHVQSMLSVLQWYRQGDLARLRGAFEGRTVLVGLTSAREVTDDVGTTPFSTSTPLVYIHANALDACSRGSFIRPVSAGGYAVALAAFALPLGWLFTILTLPRGLFATGVLVLGLAGVDQALFAARGIDIPPLLLVTLPPFTYAAVGIARYLLLERRSLEREEEIRQGRSVQQQFLPEALVGQVLAHYRITAPVGRGGMGVVYRGEDLRLGRPVAVKVLPGGALSDEQARRRFRREASALSRLTHPHTARVYDFDSQDGADFLVLEYVEGETLARRLCRGPMSEGEILVLGAQIVSAVQHAHEHGVVHRDLKPGNVIVTPEGEAKVLDFGLARIGHASVEVTVTQGSTSEAGVPIGTLPYMAPEVLAGNTADARTDVYGVGMILYEMATARRPFQDDAAHELLHTILHQEPPEPRVLNRRISVGLDRLILKALEKDPARRQSSAGELLAELSALRAPARAS